LSFLSAPDALGALPAVEKEIACIVKVRERIKASEPVKERPRR